MFEEILEQYQNKRIEIEQDLKKMQDVIELITTLNKISSGELSSTQTNSNQSDFRLLGRLIDQVDRLSKEVTDLKSQREFKRQSLSSLPVRARGTDSYRILDSHVKVLLGMVTERPGSYSTNQLVDMMGMSKSAVLNIMKRAVEADPKHFKITQGKKKAFYLTYTPDVYPAPAGSITSSDIGSGNEDHTKLELMATSGHGQ